MSRYTPTRSLATAVMTLGVTTLLALVVAMPFTALKPMTVLYVAMLVTGVGMFLRERVFATGNHAQPAPLPVAVHSDRFTTSAV